MKRRAIYLTIALFTLVLGLLWRFVWIGLPPILYKYGGSALWAAMIYWLAAFIFPRARILKLAILCAILAAAVEFFKLLHAPALDAFRLTFLGKVLVGRFFYWTAIPVYWLAIAFAALVDDRIIRRS